jgi:hypothetical protein
METMRLAHTIFLGAALLAFTAAPGQAQDDKQVHVNIGGGPNFNLGDIGTHFATGWGPAIGVTMDGPKDKFAFQFEYAYRYYSIKDSATAPPGTSIPNTFDANHQTHQMDFNFVANLTPPENNVRGYIIAGPGAYYRKVEISKYQGTGVICDPYWYVCGTYPVSSVIASRGGWDFGVNFGGGVGFKLGDSGEFYIESRFHYVWGPDIQPPTTLPAGSTTTPAGKSNGEYWPLTFGIRF